MTVDVVAMREERVTSYTSLIQSETSGILWPLGIEDSSIILSMAVNKYAQSYKHLKITIHLLTFANDCTKYLYKSLIHMCQCAFKLKMCPHTYHIM
jgi:cobalamin biosynthesis Co2+ chelatase CbiK